MDTSASGTFDVSGWTFTNWTAGTDLSAISGSSGDDTIVLGTTSRVSATDIYNGGAGVDTIQIGAASNAGTSINLSAANLQSIEGLKFANQTKISTATFSSTQFGSGLVSTNLAVTGTSARSGHCC